MWKCETVKPVLPTMYDTCTRFSCKLKSKQNEIEINEYFTQTFCIALILKFYFK